jgi:hypothetical protein
VDEHPAQRYVASPTGPPIARPLEDELDQDVERGAWMTAKLDHDADDSIRSLDDLSRRRELRDAAWLGLVPAGVALVLGLLLAPRQPTPEGLPLPIADVRALQRVSATDRRFADAVKAEPLPAPVRALGSAIRAFHSLEAQGAREADTRRLGEARRAVDGALIEALGGGGDRLIALRAVQLDGFLEEVRRLDAGGLETDELRALAGRFVQSMKNDGWYDGRRVAPSRVVLSVMFKHMWNAFLGLDSRPEFAPTLDEERALYAFFLSHPHPSKAMRDAIASARRGARDSRGCRALDEAEQAAAESWRLDKIARLGEIDATYPADYARGVVSFRAGQIAVSAKAYRAWLDKHPDGPYALRAQNYLRTVADRPE